VNGQTKRSGKSSRSSKSMNENYDTRSNSDAKTDVSSSPKSSPARSEASKKEKHNNANANDNDNDNVNVNDNDTNSILTIGAAGRGVVSSTGTNNGANNVASTQDQEGDATTLSPLQTLMSTVSNRRINSFSSKSTYNHIHENVRKIATTHNISNQGVVGLSNLGNTCFMNSSIQCLRHTIPLTDYFLGYEYRKEIHKTNVLGTKGVLVEAYATLMKEMWLGEQKVVRPSKFKSSLQQFAPQFVGTSQQDAQEVLAYLLDGIHEDLNRVKNKPYIEDVEGDGTNDERDSIKAWHNYLRRDKSVIVDIFQVNWVCYFFAKGR
jgi:hypothetical protein